MPCRFKLQSLDTRALDPNELVKVVAFFADFVMKGQDDENAKALKILCLLQYCPSIQTPHVNDSLCYVVVVKRGSRCREQTGDKQI